MSTLIDLEKPVYKVFYLGTEEDPFTRTCIFVNANSPGEARKIAIEYDNFRVIEKIILVPRSAFEFPEYPY